MKKLTIKSAGRMRVSCVSAILLSLITCVNVWGQGLEDATFCTIGPHVDGYYNFDGDRVRTFAMEFRGRGLEFDYDTCSRAAAKAMEFYSQTKESAKMMNSGSTYRSIVNGGPKFVVIGFHNETKNYTGWIAIQDVTNHVHGYLWVIKNDGRKYRVSGWGEVNWRVNNDYVKVKFHPSVRWAIQR